ncbi:MAG: hypothetical protein GY913_23290 [Proteobacteria bacterium]|nr:hypothetical protein [Pseudomonadota bacterium]MCP4919837.1 hypothetical protein [Pseudomonadota bacterium]
MSRWLIALVAALSFAWAWAHALGVHASRGGPPGWTVESLDVPFHEPSRYDLPEGGGWPLARHDTLSSRVKGPITALVRVGEEGRVELLQRNQGGGVALVLSRVGEAESVLVLRGGHSGRLECEGDLEPLGGDVTEVSLVVDQQVIARVGDSQVVCANRYGAGTERVIQAGNPRAHLVAVDGVQGPVTSMPLLLGLMAGLTAVVGGLAFWLRERLAWLPVALAPIILSAPLATVDAHNAQDALRIPTDYPLPMLVLAPAALSGVLLLTGLTLELLRRRRLAFVPIAPVVAALGASIGFGGSAGFVALAVVLALCAVGVLAVNVLRVRGFNALSLLLVGGGLVVGEALLRQSRVADTWTGVGVEERSVLADEHSQITEVRQYSTYPMSGFPIEPPARTRDVRIVAFGGSSTGGAFTNDDLDGFYPAILDRRLPRAQVVNQGVGGWTTLHIRRYVELGLETVDPDVAFFYTGHNDAVTESPVPYSTVFSQLDNGPLTWISVGLSDLRMYQGFRFALRAAAGSGAGMAVPPDDTLGNLVAIIEAVRERGGRVVLSREGMASGASQLDGHERAMRALVDDDVAYLDVAAALEDPAAGDVFLDNVHLSQEGHELLADELARGLRELGWVD